MTVATDLEHRAGILVICQALRDNNLTDEQRIQVVNDLEDICLHACNVAEAAYDVINMERPRPRLWWERLFFGGWKSW